MTLLPDNRVRLAPADWGGLCSLAVAIAALVGTTLYKVHELSASHRERLVRIESELTHVKSEINHVQEDVRTLIARRSGVRGP
jgi:hypothetical protein